ncbi:MAG: aminotransferase class I/II-fold pyridoxal phosphate-dependent enzyme [Candidatus Obscuribacterales bacterium]|jgi:aminotransferase
MTSLKPISKIASAIPVSGIRRFFDIAASMQDVISLGVGEPDFVTPWSIREAAIYSLERGQTSYTSNWGLIELRRAISEHLEQLYQVSYRPEDQILITVGVSEGLDIALRTILDAGDEVLVPEPCYVSYKPCISLAGGIPVSVETTAQEGFRVTAAKLKAHLTSRTKAILLGYPSNPTGATMPRALMEEIVRFAEANGLYILSDEIYDRLTYKGQHTCVPSIDGAFERTILFNGFSKAYAMTGWRIGYICAPSEILATMMKIHSYTMLCAPITGQKAALEALKGSEPQVLDMVEQYSQRRRVIVDGFNNIGLECHMPDGAFYAFPSIASTGLSAEVFAERLLFEQRVALVPGTAFGAGGANHVRCSYATSIDKIEQALARIKTFVEQL